MTPAPRLLALALAFAVLPLSSTALAGVTAANAERAAGADVITLSWTSSDPVDVYAADKPGAPLAGARLIAKDVRGGAHAVGQAGSQRRYFILVDAKDHQQAMVAERLVPLAQGSNFRDLGGYPAAGGKHVRWGLIYRSGGQPLLSDEDVAQVKALGVTQLVDLRSDEERELAPTRLDGIPYTAIGYSMMDLLAQSGMTGQMRNGADVYHRLPALLTPHLKVIFADLLSRRAPIVYNCSAGQDRTGFVTAMVLSALGVPREQILADYHLSTTYRRPQFEMPRLDPAAHPDNPVAKLFAQYQRQPNGNAPEPLKDAQGHAFLTGAFEEIEARYGSVDGYLQKAVGLTPQDIQRLRLLYLR
jgi:protein-tyrosine phosphatase